MHIALLAGEASGDQLGAELIQSLRAIDATIEFSGVGGELMQAQGFDSLLPMDDFAVMGITEIIKSLPRLLRYRKQLFKHYTNNPPTAFVGIDYPEFNLSLENRLKKQGIYTAHYVSPSVWAWREERIHHIKESCDLMLTLFEFEKQFYDQHNMPAVYCGHPLVDVIPPNATAETAQEKLGLEAGNYLAVLPGSRRGEVEKMMRVYLEVMTALNARLPEVKFIIPAATPALQSYLQDLLQQHAEALDCRIILRQGKMVMQAANAVLLTSGTATLEAMLLEKPMLVSYKVSRLTARLAKKRLTVKHFSLPNLLANDTVVPEFMQDDIDVDKMAESLANMLVEGDYRHDMIAKLKALRETIKTQAANNAAQALYQDLQSRHLT